MGAESDIEWTDATWNPTRGCSAISPGCANCYAERIAGRFSGPGKPYAPYIRIGRQGDKRWNGRVDLVGRHLHDPLAWVQPKKIFVNSTSDLFHDELTEHEIAAVFGVMGACKRHTFQFLTKREDRLLAWCRWLGDHPSPAYTITQSAYKHLSDAHQSVWSSELLKHEYLELPWPLPNVWAGVSVENRQHGVRRIHTLRHIPARVRFLSFEPLLEDLGPLNLLGIHWAIIGCESGPGARPCELAWVRKIITQCQDQGVRIFLKQLPDPQRKGGAISTPEIDGQRYTEFPG